MVLAFKHGPMGQNTRANGNRTKLMAVENSGTLMAMSMKASGNRIKPTGMVYMFTLMEPDMRVSGETIFKTVKDKRPGKMAQVTQEAIWKE